MLPYDHKSNQFDLPAAITTKHFIDPTTILVLVSFADLYKTQKDTVACDTNLGKIYHSWQQAFNKLPKEQKQQQIEISWQLLGEITCCYMKDNIAQSIADKVGAYIDSAVDAEHNFIELFSEQALLRISGLNISCAKVCFANLCKKLSPQNLQLLHLMLSTNRSFEFQNQEHNSSYLEDTRLNQNQIISRALNLYLAHANNQQDFMEIAGGIFKNIPNLGGKNQQIFNSLCEFEDEVIELETRGKFFSGSVSNIAFKPGSYTNEFTELKQLSTDQLRQLYTQMLDLNHLSTSLQSNNLEFEAKLWAVESILAKRNQQEFIDGCNLNFVSAIGALSKTDKIWLYVSLYIGEGSNEYKEFNIIQPTGENLNTCQAVLSKVKQSPQLWQRIIRNLENDLIVEKPKLQAYINAYFYNLANQLPDQTRLWLWLAIETRTTPMFFNCIDQVGESVSDTAVNHGVMTIADEIYMNASEKSLTFKNQLKQILLTKFDSEQDLQDSPEHLTIYLDHHLKEQLKHFDENGINWLYLAMVCNLRVSSAQKIYTTNIFPLNESASKHAEIILNRAYVNPELRAYYVSKLENMLSTEALNSFNIYLGNFLKILCKNLTPDELKLVDNCLNNLHYNAEHVAQFAGQDRIARIINVIALKPQLLPIAKKHVADYKHALQLESNSSNNSICQFVLSYADISEISFNNIYSEVSANHMVEALQNLCSPKAIAWLKNALVTGVYDTSQLFNPPGSKLILTEIQDKVYLPHLLIFVLKYEKYRNNFLAKHAKADEQFSMITRLNLNQLKFGDKGLVALCDAMYGKQAKLKHISLCNCGLKGDSLITATKRLFMQNRYSVIDIAENKISIANLKQLRDYLLTESPSKANVNEMAAADKKHYMQHVYLVWLISFLNSRDLIGYLWARYRFEDELEKVDKKHFFQAEANALGYEVADFLLETVKENLSLYYPPFNDSLKALIDPNFEYNQPVHAAINSRNPTCIKQVLEIIVGDLQLANDLKLIEYLNDCVKSQKFVLPDASSVEYSELFKNADNKFDMRNVEKLIQMACLVQALAGHELDSPLVSNVYGFREFHLANTNISDILKASVANCINIHPIDSLDISNMQLSDGSIYKLVELLAAANISKINISANKINQARANQLVQLLASNTNIKSINVSDCFTSLAATKEFIAGIAGTGLEELVLTNPASFLQQNASAQPAFCAELLDDIIKQLKDSECPVTKLVLANNNLHDVWINQFIDKLIDNNIFLTELDFSNNHCGDKTVQALAKYTAMNPKLERVNISGHHAKAKELDQMLNAVHEHENLQHINWQPSSSMLQQHPGEYARFLEYSGSFNIKAKLSRLICKFDAMHMSDSQSDIEEELNLANSGSTLHSSFAGTEHLAVSEQPDVVQVATATNRLFS